MILLVYPNISSRERYNKDIDAIGGHQLPLGVYCLAAYLRANHFPTQVLDAEACHLSHEEICQAINSETKIVGISSTTVAFKNARSLAEFIKNKFPHIKIVIGGPQMTAMPKLTMETKAFDFGIVREGEIPFLKLVQALQEGKSSFESIPNLYYFASSSLLCYKLFNSMTLMRK